MTPIKTPKKLIEVALPLDAINAAAAREKSIRHGHPSTLHLWWARRPLAAARAVIFAQMVNDPGYERHLGRGVNKEKAALEQERLFKIIEDLVLWENTNNETVLERAREEIRKSWRETCALNRNHPRAAELFDPEKLPAFHDPFAGGGALPLEAQRLGLEAWASDLNPVAVTINKAMIEIPPRFAGRAPVHPAGLVAGKSGTGQGDLFRREWKGAEGLAEDIRYYGAWMREEAERRIGHLYPKIEITAAMATDRPDLKPLVGQSLTVIAWLWARTVRSPNPAFSHVEVPLASNFALSSKAGKEAYVEPVVEGDRYRFVVKMGTPPEAAAIGTKLARGGNFRCLFSGSPMDPKYIKGQGIAGRMGARLMAIVAEGVRGRIYLAPTEDAERIANDASAEWKPETALPNDARAFTPIIYGMGTYGHLFTPRQLVALTTFSDLVQDAIKRCRQDMLAAGVADDCVGLDDGGSAATAYAEAVGVLLGLGVSRYSNACTTICTWNPGEKKEDIRFTFSRQALPMTWDFAEGNPWSGSSGNFADNFDLWNKLAEQAHPAFPVTIYYAFKQSETHNESDTTSTGWETFLEAAIQAGFGLTGTWPIRTERDGRTRGIGANALASSIVLVCRKRAADAPTVSRREFIRELNAVLPDALDEMTRGGVNSPVAPVDLSQAIIGPGMAIFSQYAAVLEADGKPMSVRTALQLINRFLAEDDFDHDTQFCLHWFETQGWATGRYGEADVLARAKGTSVGGLAEAGVLESGKGELRLLRWAEYPRDWSPESDARTPVWEALHQLIRALNQEGESAAGALLARMPTRAEPIRALAYRLYTLCERKGWAEDARAYNELVTAWTSIEQAAGDAGLYGSQAQLDI
jgi:adenine-specific DNA methylase